MRHAVLVSALLLLVVPGALPGVVGQPGGTTPTAVAQADTPASVDAMVDRRTTVFRVSMDRSGDARWTVTTLYELDGPAERAAFTRFAAAYRNGTAGAGPDPSAWRAAAATAADATGRQMTIRGVSRSADLRNDTTGALVLRFRWTNFAERTENSTFRVRDVFQATDGTWLPRLGSEQVLIVETVADARIVSTNYPLTNLNVRVEGPRDLAAEPVDLGYTLGVTPTVTPSPTPTATPSPTATPRPPTTTTTPTREGGDTVAFGAVVLLLAAAVVALIAYQGGFGGAGAVAVDDDDRDGGAPAAEPGTDTAPTPDTDVESDAESDVESEPEPDPEPEPEPEPELLSDEERVERLLEQNGGRMRQADIVSETGWSDAKVSQLLSAMAEEGRVDKLRLGRENLISFPDADETDEE
ncbi:helix-turn-helix transcriptional regulator [Halobaculum sp. MBLA0143]|uniref:helix-turn-helix transcriptional regulator n=1 Tax=Halobaculum sp. MBLA0143 TaxID=3079933 RepID=UPI003525B160